ncbi:MFS transporter [Mariluticola halotolerans]|uniref:MFS transporter n=1 Tax=Mariluticola halotolerans TaxID=2909283 RepID=UPI0026E2343B|nr:MFS transporter [Mariluticola halotolerans]UJQ94861.1 MFS transporter [Mariluticola halotolerans]
MAFAVSALLKPIAGELDLGRAAVSAAVGLGRLVAGLTSPAAGRISDLVSPRYVVFAGMIVTAIGLFATGLVQAQWHLYLAWSLLVSGGVAAGFTVALDKIVISAVREGRGMALALRFSVAGLVTTLMMPMVATMIEVFGWRGTCFAWGGLLMVLAPVSLVVLPGRIPAYTAQKPVPGGGVPGEDGLAGLPAIPDQGWRQAAGTLNYWIVAFTFMAQAAANTGLVLHLVPLMTDSGFDAGIAASLVGALVLLSIPIRLLTGKVADAVHPGHLPMLLGGLMLLEAVAIGSYAVMPSFATLLALLFALGVSAGAPTLIVLVLISHLFGDQHYGTLQGSLMMLQVPGTMMAPFAAGFAYDTMGTYAPAIAGFAILLCLGGLLLLRLRMPAREQR